MRHLAPARFGERAAHGVTYGVLTQRLDSEPVAGTSTSIANRAYDSEAILNNCALSGIPDPSLWPHEHTGQA